MTDKRRISQLLPEVLQTNVLQKFFAATADNLFQPGNIEQINGYIGEKPSWYDPNKDFYIAEQTADRQNYQLEPLAVSLNTTSGQITNTLFYSDLINNLRFNGAITTDPSRLFEGEYYSFGLPFDPDKWLNYSQYVWLPKGPDTISLLDATNAAQITSSLTFTYSGRYSFASDPNTIVDGGIAGNELVFTSGLKVRFLADYDLNIRQTDFVIEGVGRSIKLIADIYNGSLAWDVPPEYDSTVWDQNTVYLNPYYICMGRGSKNKNPWSYKNRWFHKDVVSISKTSTTDAIVANRQIIEFDPDIELYDYGNNFRAFATVVDKTTVDLRSIVGKSSYTVDGVNLDDGMIVLFTALTDSNANNKLYKVTNLRDNGNIVLALLPNAADLTGSPTVGDLVHVLQGASWNTEQSYPDSWLTYYWTGSVWKQGQQWTTTAFDPFPKFYLYDNIANKLDDPSVYPLSTFAGSTLFEYNTQTYGIKDPFLGFVPVYDPTQTSDLLFTNTLTTQTFTYQDPATQIVTSIPGYYFWKTSDTNGNDFYANNWFKSPNLTRQFVVNQYNTTTTQSVFNIDQQPTPRGNTIPTITVEVNGTNLQQNVDFVVNLNNTITLTAPVAANTNVKIRTWNANNNQATNGYYEIPRNLEANPNNGVPTATTRSSLLSHLENVIFNQIGFNGNASGLNNWRDTAQNWGLGTVIVQHRASMLKLSVLNSINQTNIITSSVAKLDPMSAMRWAQRDYLRFYNKFVNALFTLYDSMQMTATTNPQAWIDAALKIVNVAKTVNSAWANSGWDTGQAGYCSLQSTNPTYVPASATRLGVMPAWQPVAFYDDTQPNSPLSIRCHNGAIVVLRDGNNQDLGGILYSQQATTNPEYLTHPVAKAWLLFEQLMFNSMPTSYTDINRLPDIDIRTVFSGKYRKTNYSRDDQIALLRPMFDLWSTNNQLDLFNNTTFDSKNAFTWNYSQCVDQDNQPLPGHWRGIYFYYYDTDRPHTAPWEMLGFVQKPDWWDTEYGVAPYTKGNTKMWNDLSLGKIAQGPRAGIYQEWARPTLLNYLPVDQYGQLLSPDRTGIIQVLPSINQASAPWKFGDRSPIENVWLTTVDIDIALSQVLYLAKPAAFIEYFWDGARNQQLYSNQSNAQWVCTLTGTRTANNQLYVSGENPQNVSTLTSMNTTTYFGSCGIQRWISEYLINDSINVTTYFGDVIRGSDVRLGWRAGGFIDNSSIKVMVDSFGLSQNDNLLIPQEDVRTILSRSGSIEEFFYSGVIVEFMGTAKGWRVIGYDSINPYFTIIPSDKNGPKNTVVIDHATVTEYLTGTNTTATIAYTTLFSTRQEVYDFLISYGRYQASIGWTFDGFNDTAARPQDWSLSAREFLFWSQGPWAPGTYIALSPLSSNVKFTSKFGAVQYVGDIVNGNYSLLDKSGRPIRTNDVEFLRIDDTVTVTPLNGKAIFGLRLYSTTIEHAIIFNNQTIFGDTVYDPVLDIRQSRAKLVVYRTLNWTGRIEAPGYVVAQKNTTIGDITTVNSQVITNFEKSVTDIREVYNIDHPTSYITSDGSSQTSSITQTVSPKTSALAKHLIAYQARDYFTNLLIDDASQFQFYQGMIRQKGTENAINSFARNKNVLAPTEQLNYYEEWAFRTGVYGSNDLIYGLDIVLAQDQMVANPQEIHIMQSGQTYDTPRDDVITIIPNDTRIVSQTASFAPWTTRSYYGSGPNDLPTAGYALLTEVNYTVADETAFLSLWSKYNTTTTPLQPRQRVWKFIDNSRGWDIYQISVPVWKISGTSPTVPGSLYTTVTTTAAHGLVNGNYVIIQGAVGVSDAINGTFKISNVTATTFDINLQTTDITTGGTIWSYFSVRFQNYTSLLNSTPPDGWAFLELAYVDGTTSTPYTVYSRGYTNWTISRQEELKVDPTLILNSKLYNINDGVSVVYPVLWDPVKGVIPGILAKEINYITSLDPAKYNSGDTQLYSISPENSWGPEQVGVTWWNTKTTRFVEYETGPNSYRRQNWGQIAPGTSIDIYEWIRSTVPPASWAGSVASGNAAATGGSSLPTGSIVADGYPYVVKQERTVSGSYSPVYYFWIKNSTTVPTMSFRTLSTRQISSYISDPQNLNQSWWSPISATNAIVGNFGEYLKGNQVVWQTNWASTADYGKIFKQWSLLRPGDPLSSPTAYLWNRMRYSLVEFDNAGHSVPDLYLPATTKCGIQTRPSQTWFNNAYDARRAFVQTVNNILSTASTPPATDTERVGYIDYLNSAEPVPNQSNILENVRLATTSNLLAFYHNGEQGVDASLTAAPILQSNTTYYQPLVIDGVMPNTGDRVLVKNQTQSGSIVTNAQAQNGIYIVINSGTSRDPWVMRRALDMNSVSASLSNAQVTVTDGFTNKNSIWFQNNLNILQIGRDSFSWSQGFAPSNWDYAVADLAGLAAADYQFPFGTKILVTSTSSLNNKWSIWQWTQGVNQTGSWQLLRVQSYNTSTCWQYVDWYASGYSAATTIAYTWNTLSERDAFTAYKANDVVKVTNIGNGLWNLFVYNPATIPVFTLIGAQNGGIELLDNLWNYEKYGMGFGNNWDVTVQGYEYDTRLELDSIIQALWPNASGQSGLLKMDNTLNEYNSLFFIMLNHVFAEQKWVDWAFKTSFISLSGFAQNLDTTPYYKPSGIDSLIGYITEAKPFHAVIRQFTDTRKSTDIWTGNNTDFDNPPLQLSENQIQILDANTQSDALYMASNRLYQPYINNYKIIIETAILIGDGVKNKITLVNPVGINQVVVTINGTTSTQWGVNPANNYEIVLQQTPNLGDIVQVSIYGAGSLVRRIHTQIKLDRTSCSLTPDVYVSPYSAATEPDYVVATVLDMNNLVVNGLPDQTIVKVTDNIDGLWALYKWNDALGLKGNPVVAETGMGDIQTLIHANIDFVVAETIAFVQSQYFAPLNPSQVAIFDQQMRNMLSAIMADLLVGITNNTVLMANRTWAQSVSLVPLTVDQFTGASNYVKTLVASIAQNQVISRTYQTAIKQTILSDYRFAGYFVDQFYALLQQFVNIVRNGSTATAIPVVSDPVSNAQTLILNNIEFIRAQTTAWVVNHYPVGYALTDDQLTKCGRDIGLIVYSVVNDLLQGGNKNSIAAGNSYYNAGASVLTYNSGTQRNLTAGAIEYASSLVQSIAANQVVGNLYASGQPQQVLDNSLIGGEQVVTTISDLMTTIADIIVYGSSTSSYNQIPTSAGNFSSQTLVYRNTNFLAAEAIAWIKSNYPTFNVDEVLWRSRMVTAIQNLMADFLAGITTNTTIFGNRFWNGATSILLQQDEMAITIGAYDYIKSLLPSIITNANIPAPYQTAVSQVYDTRYADGYVAITTLTSLVDNFTSIILNGPVITQSVLLEQDQYNSAETLIVNNLNWLESQAVALLGTLNDYSQFVSTATDRELFKRDLRLIITSMVDDFLSGTNINSRGVAKLFWSNSLLKEDKTAVVLAVNTCVDLLQYVLNNSPNSVQYDNTVSQMILPVYYGGNIALTTIQNLAADVVYIIQNGGIQQFEQIGYATPKGAVDRIDTSYLPTATMPPKNDPYLIGGCAGTLNTIDGSNFLNVGRWGEPIWDNPEGWDQTVQSANDYYDTFINGGSVPQFQTFIGDGATTSFKLNSVPLDPNRLSVWVAGNWLQTPSGWYIPNYATNIALSGPGLGYSVNDIVTLSGGTASLAATAKVLNVDGIGRITSLQLIQGGSYTTIPDGPVALSGGTGTQANVIVNWGGDSIQFTVAPPKSNRVNIWVGVPGTTFLPAFSSLIDNWFDGGPMNQVYYEPGHPEELFTSRTNDSVSIDVYTVSSGPGPAGPPPPNNTGGSSGYSGPTTPVPTVAGPIGPYPSGITGGFGKILNESFTSDGVKDRFYIGQPVTCSNEITVYVNGKLTNYGIMNDYVYDFMTNSVVFVNPPAAGTVTITSIGYGGAGYGLSDSAILAPGSGYAVEDIVNLVENTSASLNAAQVQVTALLATEISLVSGGTGYSVGDLVYYQDGIRQNVLTLRVTAVVGTTVSALEIVDPGFYTQLNYYGDLWSTNGQGTNLAASVKWGIAAFTTLNRGLFTAQDSQFVQTTSPKTQGSGVVIASGNTRLVGESVIVSNGVDTLLPLPTKAQADTLLVVRNGDPVDQSQWVVTQDYQHILLRFQPSLGDTLHLFVYQSSVISLQNKETFLTVLNNTTYTIARVPASGTFATPLLHVYKDELLLTPYTDYILNGNKIEFSTALAATFDPNNPSRIDVITWNDDITSSLQTEEFTGTTGNNLYPLSNVPVLAASVQVWLNGKMLSRGIDYLLIVTNGAWYVQMLAPYDVLTNTDIIMVDYPIGNSAQPAIAFRLTTNIYGDSQALRLADSATTTLAADFHFADTQIVVSDGSKIVQPTATLPGAIYIGRERIEYWQTITDSTDQNPNQMILQKLVRGSLGTPWGIYDSYTSQFFNGDNKTTLFAINNYTDGVDYEVWVDDQLKAQFVDYEIVTNPANAAPGIYISFTTAPDFGDRNIRLMQVVASIVTNTLSHAAGSLVRDATPRQNIPGGYVWPYGNNGLQYSDNNMGKFLLAEPGTNLG